MLDTVEINPNNFTDINVDITNYLDTGYQPLGVCGWATNSLHVLFIAAYINNGKLTCSIRNFSTNIMSITPHIWIIEVKPKA